MRPVPPQPTPYAGGVKSPRILALTAAAVLVLVLSGCSTPTEPEQTPSASAETNSLAAETACEGDEGVTFVIDGSALADQKDVSATWCVFADEPIAAADVLAAAGVETEGTEEYGDQVVCRVDGAPAADAPLTAEDGSEYVEKCESMPAAFAYWSLWVKPAGAEWDYAQEGLSTLQLEPGESLGLLFTLNGEPATLTS